MVSILEIQSASEEPIYNIGVVARMTGISMATLRAWERRYDFPESKRTVGGHRLFSERDIIRLGWVKQRIDNGMQTSQAIRALHYQEQTGQTVLTDENFSGQSPRRSVRLHSLDLLEQDGNQAYFSSLQGKVIAALAQNQTHVADDLLGEALAIFPPEALILNVIRPVLEAIGTLWEQNKISVATEHQATNYLRQCLLVWMVNAPPPESRKVIVLACAPDEWHEGSILILGALLRRRLWPVIYLGQAVPFPDLARFVQVADPSLVVVVAMTENTALNMSDWVNVLSDVASHGRPIFCFGGRIFVEKPEWRLKVLGVYLGNTIEEGIFAIEKLLR